MDKMLETRLREAFYKGRVDFDAHVSIIPTLDRPRYFGLMRQSAVLLDTLGFSGFNTALQAIECDLPVLAFEGDFMRGRLASGILRQLGLPELVASTTEEFVAKAIALAGDAAKRKALKIEIRARRNVLFNDLAPVRELERQLTNAVMINRAARSSTHPLDPSGSS
jgi:predicted O-linked N-acetylglucosamine transferase (SPINDLY family)